MRLPQIQSVTSVLTLLVKLGRRGKGNLFVHRPNPRFSCTDSTEIIPLLSGNEWLSTYADEIERIADLAAVTQSHFDTYYRPVLTALAELVQGLPAPHSSKPRTLLALRLNAAQQALARRRAYLLPAGTEPERIAREADLWSYAVFTLALLKNLTRDLAALEVMLVDAQGQVIGRWQPWQEEIGPTVAGLRIEMADPGPACDWTPLLISKLLPMAGTEWLWRNAPVFQVWLAVLSDSGEIPEAIRMIFQPSREETTHGT